MNSLNPRSTQNLHHPKVNFDQTKDSFIQKLKDYKALSKSKQNDSFQQTFKSSINNFYHSKQKQNINQFISSKLRSSSSKKFSSKPLTNSIEQFRQKLYGKSQFYPQSSYSYLSNRYLTQQKLVNQECDFIINQLSLIDGKYASYRTQQEEFSRQNFLKLQNLEKYLISSQKVHQNDVSLISQKSKQIVEQRLQKGSQILKNKHKNRLDTVLKSLTSIDQQSQLLGQGVQNQSQLCQNDWCEALDKINFQILDLNRSISQAKIQQMNRFSQTQWRIKQMKFNCQQLIQKQHKQRIGKDLKLQNVLQKLIQRVGSM